jgi:hypothetical protein
MRKLDYCYEVDQFKFKGFKFYQIDVKNIFLNDVIQ